MKKIHFLILFFALSFLQTPLKLSAQRISIGKKFKLESEILKETREYWVYLPDSYNNGYFSPQKYPVMILLDGNSHFHAATGIVQFLAATKKIPEMIVVGIPNTDRNRDLTPVHSQIALDGKKIDFLKTTGGGDAFLEFIEQELMPTIDSSYRTLPYKLLAGHSFGGLLALHSFLKNKDTFKAYITMDPAVWFGERFLEKELRRTPDSINFKSSLYISVANNNGGKTDTTETRKAINDFYALLNERNPDLHSKISYFEEEDHGSVPLLSINDGLNFIFKGYFMMNLYDKSLEEIQKHFEQVSLKMGAKVLPPQSLINSIGSFYLHVVNNYDQALDFFNWNVEMYPESFSTHENLGLCYKMQKKNRKAKKCFQKALELNPSSVFAQQRLEELEK